MTVAELIAELQKLPQELPAFAVGDDGELDEYTGNFGRYPAALVTGTGPWKFDNIGVPLPNAVVL